MLCVKVAVLCVLQTLFSATVGTSLNPVKSTSEGSKDDSLDDRFNINLSYGQAQGVGRHGGVSQSNSLSYGINAGIRGPSGQYQNLFSDSRSHGQSYSSGPGAPLTYANTGSRVGPGQAGGNAAAGVYGGQGSSFATSQNQNIAIPLDNRGTVLLSNLKERNATQPSNSPPDVDTGSKKKPESSSSLVFERR